MGEDRLVALPQDRPFAVSAVSPAQRAELLAAAAEGGLVSGGTPWVPLVCADVWCGRRGRLAEIGGTRLCPVGHETDPGSAVLPTGG